ncbi:hypothetical protein [Nonlabens antarcticus]|uniref:hypothetical protein n=1 Tax=Nonlabens antarcticus TaxID=392714 RepID=UPI001890DD83|nr:hypothetical protein [Nonlabens antarcticus]
MNEIIFQESQKFKQWWLWLIIIFTSIIIIISAVAAAVEYPSTISTIVIVCSLFGVMGMIVLFYIMKLTTIITREKISVQFYPILKREWNWSDLKMAKVIDYGFVGGWGIRLWTGMGTVYNIKGSKGLHIKTDSKEYVIGSQKEEELRSSIAHLLK